jgi:hypothetical protein
MHIAISLNSDVPWQWSVITTTMIAVGAVYVCEEACRATTGPQLKMIAIHNLWLLSVHYVPIFSRGMWQAAAVQCCLFLFMLLFYCKVKTIENRFKTVSINNAIMHVGVIANNLIAHNIASM